MIFSATGLYAQLYISPSTQDDSYIYLKDRLLFVQDEIHLVENHKKETGANIYLRRNSQLLQGTKNLNLNKGNGQLSVFQKGTTNAYDYNYWAMPVGINESKEALNEYLYEPLSNTESRSAKLISALDGHSDPLSISTKWIYTFAGSNYSDWLFLGDHFDLIPGEGFTMKGVNGINLKEVESEFINSGNAQLYDFRGMPNDGNIDLPIKKDQILLVGNPYPSAFDLDTFLKENTTTTGIAYFWDSRKNGNSHYLSDYEGGYGTYSPGTGIYVPPAFKRYSDGSETGEIGDNHQRNVLPIAQGFMVIGKNEGFINFRNDHRIYQKEIPNVNSFKSPITEQQSLKLNIELDSAYIQPLILAFKSESTSKEDHAMDARKMQENINDIGWVIDEDLFVINVRPKVNEELIPLKISLQNEAVIKFSVAEFINFNPDRVFIYDAKDDLYFSIKTGYLKTRLPQGEYKDRFYLSFIEKLPSESPKTEEGLANTAQPEKKPPNILLNSVDIFQNNPRQQLEIRMLYESEISQVSLYDLNGKLFFSQDFKINEKEFNFSTGNLSNAIYIVKVKTTDNKELTKKIGIKN